MRGKFPILAFLAACFLFPAAAFSQTTVVSGTVVDPNGVPYGNGTVTARLTAPGATVTINNQAQCTAAGAGSAPCKLPIQGTVGPTRMDATGTFSMTLYSNGSINPGGTQWVFTVAISPGVLPPWGTGQQSFTASITVAGATQSISATLNALAPALTQAFSAGGGTVTSVSCGNLVNVFTCSVTAPTTTPALVFTPISSGPSLDCSTFPGAPDAGLQINNCLAALPSGTGIADATKFGPTATITTPIVDSSNAVIAVCGTTFREIGNITLMGTDSALAGCPGDIAVFQKAANIDQVVMYGQGATLVSVSLEGEKASYTGNGITIDDSGGTHMRIESNLIDGEANDDIYDNEATYSQSHILSNVLTGWGLHGYQSSSTSAQNIFQANTLMGDGTSTGAAILNAGSSRLLNNWVSDSNATVLIDDTTGGQQHPVNSNTLKQTGGYPGLEAGALTVANGNTLTAGGSHGPAIDASTHPGATISSNVVNVTNGDGIDGGNGTTISDNQIDMNMSGVSGKCGVNLVGDTIGFRSHHNQITISDNMADTNYGTCDTPTGAHNLDVVFDGDQVETTLSGGAAAFGFFMNNAADLNTNWSVYVENLGCVHMTTCIKRTDTQNNYSVYQNINQGDAALDAGTGSTNDIFLLSGPTLFANLPSPAGPGSIVQCSNCQTLSVVAAGGLGGTVYRQTTTINGSSTTSWTGVQGVVGQDNETSVVTGNLAPVTLIPSTNPTGSYLVSIYAEVTTGVATSTIVTGIAYHDDTGAQTQYGVLFSAATTGTVQSLVFPVRFVTGTALTYSTSTANSPQYKIFARVRTQ